MLIDTGGVGTVGKKDANDETSAILHDESKAGLTTNNLPI